MYRIHVFARFMVSLPKWCFTWLNCHLWESRSTFCKHNFSFDIYTYLSMYYCVDRCHTSSIPVDASDIFFPRFYSTKICFLKTMIWLTYAQSSPENVFCNKRDHIRTKSTLQATLKLPSSRAFISYLVLCRT